MRALLINIHFSFFCPKTLPDTSYMAGLLKNKKKTAISYPYLKHKQAVAELTRVNSFRKPRRTALKSAAAGKHKVILCFRAFNY